jgi:hypothetical protein
MKKFIGSLLVVVSLMVAIPSQAQLIRFGVKGGVNYNSTSFSGNVSSKDYVGYFFGPTVDLKVPFLGFGVDGSLLYSQKGISADDANSKSQAVKEILLPINLKYTIGSSVAGVFLFTGPQFAFNLDKNGNDEQRDYSFKSSNLSFNFGLGLKILNNFQVAADYNIPISKTADYKFEDSTTYISNCKTKGWMFSLAYMF